jgi:hypothetical protein
MRSSGRSGRSPLASRRACRGRDRPPAATWLHADPPCGVGPLPQCQPQCQKLPLLAGWRWRKLLSVIGERRRAGAPTWLCKQKVAAKFRYLATEFSRPGPKIHHRFVSCHGSCHGSGWEWALEWREPRVAIPVFPLRNGLNARNGVPTVRLTCRRSEVRADPPTITEARCRSTR